MIYGKTILLVILLYSTTTIALAGYLYYYTPFSDWVGLISVYLSGVIVLGYGLGAVPKNAERA
jgi:ABC-type transport system involved in multi-copper enzyme maturation permease subunit